MHKTVYLNFFDGIDPVKVNKFIQFTTEVIRQHQPTELYFLIASNGGDVDSGFVLYNFLLSLQGKIVVTMHNTGTIDSIANVIFAAGQNRYAAPNASFLFHGRFDEFRWTSKQNSPQGGPESPRRHGKPNCAHRQQAFQIEYCRAYRTVSAGRRQGCEFRTE